MKSPKNLFEKLIPKFLRLSEYPNSQHKTIMGCHKPSKMLNKEFDQGYQREGNHVSLRQFYVLKVNNYSINFKCRNFAMVIFMSRQQISFKTFQQCNWVSTARTMPQLFFFLAIFQIDQVTTYGCEEKLKKETQSTKTESVMKATNMLKT